MKRVLNLLLLFGLILGLCACGQRTATTVSADTPTWQEQYDLGIRYLSEGNYEEAIIAFTAAIEIDPKQADAYMGLADVYTAQGNPDKAAEILKQALEILGEDKRISAALATLAYTGPQPLEGYPKTEREDYENGRYCIVEYNEFGKQIRRSHYTADGNPDGYMEYTYTDEQLSFSFSYYRSEGDKAYDHFYDVEGETQGIYQRVIEEISYTSDGQLNRHLEYRYTPGSMDVEIIMHHSSGTASFRYTMQHEGNRVEESGSDGDYTKIRVEERGGNWGENEVRRVWIARDGTALEEEYRGY